MFRSSMNRSDQNIFYLGCYRLAYNLARRWSLPGLPRAARPSAGVLPNIFWSQRETYKLGEKLN